MVWRGTDGKGTSAWDLASRLPYFVGVFKLAVADRRSYHTLGEFLRAAEAWINFYHLERPHEGLDNLPPLQYVQQYGLKDIPSLTLL